jgi:hypothetical protein
MIPLKRKEVLSFRPVHRALGRIAQAKSTCAGLPQIVSVVAGVRPATDDWVPFSAIESYERAAAELGLTVLKDTVFAPMDSDLALGISRLTTTRARGGTLKQARDGDTLHVFVGIDKSAAERAQAAGWYPLVIGDAVAPAAWSDAEEFGAALGYPDCCVDSFLKNNFWDELGHLQRLGYPAAADLARNFLPRHIGLSWAFHIPCSWDCPQSLEQAYATREAMYSLDPDYVRLIDAAAHVPVLIFSERTLYMIFRDENGFFDPLFVGGSASNDRYSAALKHGRELLIDGDVLAVYEEDAHPKKVLTTRPVGMEAEVPVIYSFESIG